MESEVVDSILGALFVGDTEAEVQARTAACLDCLQELTRDTDLARAILSNGAFESKLLRVLESSCPASMLTSALHVILSVLDVDDGAVARAMSSAQSVQALASVLRSLLDKRRGEGDVELRNDCVAVLLRLATSGDGDIARELLDGRNSPVGVLSEVLSAPARNQGHTRPVHDSNEPNHEFHRMALALFAAAARAFADDSVQWRANHAYLSGTLSVAVLSCVEPRAAGSHVSAWPELFRTSMHHAALWAVLDLIPLCGADLMEAGAVEALLLAIEPHGPAIAAICAALREAPVRCLLPPPRLISSLVDGLLKASAAAEEDEDVESRILTALAMACGHVQANVDADTEAEELVRAHAEECAKSLAADGADAIADILRACAAKTDSSYARTIAVVDCVWALASVSEGMDTLLDVGAVRALSSLLASSPRDLQPQQLACLADVAQRGGHRAAMEFLGAPHVPDQAGLERSLPGRSASQPILPVIAPRVWPPLSSPLSMLMKLWRAEEGRMGIVRSTGVISSLDAPLEGDDEGGADPLAEDLTADGTQHAKEPAGDLRAQLRRSSAVGLAVSSRWPALVKSHQLADRISTVSSNCDLRDKVANLVVLLRITSTAAFEQATSTLTSWVRTPRLARRARKTPGIFLTSAPVPVARRRSAFRSRRRWPTRASWWSGSAGLASTSCARMESPSSALTSSACTVPAIELSPSRKPSKSASTHTSMVLSKRRRTWRPSSRPSSNPSPRKS